MNRPDNLDDRSAVSAAVPGRGRAGEAEADLRKRKTFVGWLAFGWGAASFFLLLLHREPSLALQFSAGMMILTLLGFRWWTNPVHPGILTYMSPHSIILFHSFFYFGLGSLPRLAFPHVELVGYYNIGAEDFYLPMLMLGLLGLGIFDLVYRGMVRAVGLNDRMETGLESYHTPQIQAFLPLAAFFWYSVCLLVFVYMSRTYIMHIHFTNVEGAVDNIFLQSAHSLIATAWAVMSLMFFRSGPRLYRNLVPPSLALLLPFFFAFQNRRILIYCLVTTVFAYFIYSRKGVKLKTVALWGVLILGAFLIMTSARYVTITDPSIKRFAREDRNVIQRTLQVITAPELRNLEGAETAFESILFRRLNGLDWAAAMMAARSYNPGISFLWGRHNFPAAATIIPRVIWPGKPLPAIERVIDQHFELARFDQLGSLIGSAYADGGVVGVVIGFGFLGIFFPLVLRFIFIRKDAMIIYLGGMIPLLAYENFILKYSLQWLRWVLILMAAQSALLFLFTIMQARREGAEI